jgi:hypothetical protein
MPNPMTPEDKEKDLEPVRPAAMVTDKDEKIASQSQEGEVPSDEEQRELSPREMIYQKHDELHRPSMPPAGASEEPVLNEPVAKTETPEAAPQRQKPGPKAQVEVTINGNTRKVDAAKVEAAGGVDAYQMMVAGQEKLRMISQRQKELDDREAAIKLREESPRTPTAPAEEPRAKSPDLATPVEDHQSNLRQQANEALLDGDTKEAGRLNALADKALVDTASKNAIRHVEQNQRKEAESRRVRHERAEAETRKTAIETGTANFAIEYPEIMADKHLLTLADAETVEIARDNPEWTPTQVMQQAGKNVTKLGLKQPAEEVPPVTLNPKAAEKRSMRSPQPGSQRSPRKPQPVQATKSDYVLELQQRRGQA